MLKNLANFITFTRVIFAPILAIYFFSSFNEGNNIILVLIFVLASVTDFLDGFVARRLNQVSLLGKFLDPVADKVSILIVIIYLTQKTGVEGLFILIYFVLLCFYFLNYNTIVFSQFFDIRQSMTCLLYPYWDIF